jgi:hypothetical protein
MRSLKVWCDNLTVRGKTVKAIVAAPTKKRAAELLKVSMSYFNNYFSETGNEEDIKTALARPEIVLVNKERFSGGVFVTLEEMQNESR